MSSFFIQWRLIFQLYVHCSFLKGARADGLEPKDDVGSIGEIFTGYILFILTATSSRWNRILVDEAQIWLPICARILLFVLHTVSKTSEREVKY